MCSYECVTHEVSVIPRLHLGIVETDKVFPVLVLMIHKNFHTVFNKLVLKLFLLSNKLQ